MGYVFIDHKYMYLWYMFIFTLLTHNISLHNGHKDGDNTQKATSNTMLSFILQL